LALNVKKMASRHLTFQTVVHLWLTRFGRKVLRILSFSDIHGELEAFDVMIEQLPKLTFDVVLIAGDMGGREESKTIFQQLSTFGKQIFYIMGNWDHSPYNEVLHEHAIHIHLKHQRIGEWIFLGYSGSVTNGYEGHPTLSGSYVAYQSDHRSNKRKFGSYESYCKALALEELSSLFQNTKLT
jgi:hypothetical protein